MGKAESDGRRWFPAMMLGAVLIAVWSPLAAGKVGLHIGLHFGHYAYPYHLHHYGHRSSYYHRRYRGVHQHETYHRPTRRYPPARTIAPAPDATPRVIAVFTGGDGWALLRDGRPRDAQAAFGGAAARSPRSGQPKAGFSIAAALSGEHAMAAWAMRRALRLDPDGVRRLEFETSLHRAVVLLIDDYATIKGDIVDRRDAAFMQAALHYLLREPDPARRALEEAAALGERNPGAANLRRLIESLNPAG